MPRLDQNRRVYGSRKVWRQLQREGFQVARYTVERLMPELNPQGALRGRRLRTTIPDDAADRPQDLVKRNFTATRPTQLRLADLTYVATRRSLVYMAFVIDAFARRIVRTRVTQTLRTDLVLDALEQALYHRPLGSEPALVHHSGRGVQYLSIRYTERLAEAEIEPSVGSRGDSYDNAGPSRSSVSTRPRSSTVAHRGAPSKRSNWPRSTGSIGSTTAGCSPRSAVSLRSSAKSSTIAVRRLQSWWLESRNSVCGKPGTVQFRGL